MIEIIYNKEKESAVGNEEYFCVPRNIRQIGQPSSDCKIYVEDYVYGYLSKDWKETESKGRLAILLGKSNWKDGIFYIFLKSTILVEDMEVTGEYISMKDETWGKIYEEMKEYFPGQEVIGWYLSLPGSGLKITDLIKRIHLNHFGGNDKVLYLADPEEQDNAFFVYRNGRLEKQSGYYIFYEKNAPMQEYLLGRNPKASVDFTGEAQDRAVTDFRKIIARKREERESKSSDKTFTFLTAGVAVAAVVLGVMWMQKGFSENNTIQNELNETIIESVQESIDGVADDVTSDVSSDGVNEILDDFSGEEITEQTEGVLNVQQELQNEQEEVGDVTDLNEVQDSNIQSASADVSGQPESDSSNITDTESAETSAISRYTEYTIRQGDTISGISIRYYGDMSRVAEICKINSMKEDDTIYPGQKILLP